MDPRTARKEFREIRGKWDLMPSLFPEQEILEKILLAYAGAIIFLLAVAISQAVVIMRLIGDFQKLIGG